MDGNGAGASLAAPRRDLRDDDLTDEEEEATEAPHVPKSWGAIATSMSRKGGRQVSKHQMCAPHHDRCASFDTPRQKNKAGVIYPQLAGVLPG